MFQPTPLERYNNVLERISHACSIAGRSEKEVTLVGVTKGQTIENIRKFIGLGLKDIGESYFQEAITKIPLINNSGIKIHFIGHLQSNKVKKVLPLVNTIHSIDSLKLVKEVNKRVNQIITETELKIKDPYPVLVQVNLSGEKTKSGCSPEDTFNIIKEIVDNSPHLSCDGLMVISPFDAVTEDSLHLFYKKTKRHHDIILENFPNCKELSCGMSDDFEIAIEEGSTIIRLGTVLLGRRK